MKIVSSGRVINSSEFYKKKKKRRRILAIFLAIGLLAIVSLFVYISRLERLQISGVIISGSDTGGQEEITQAVERLLAGNYLWVIPRTNILVYPKSAIREDLLKEFPKFKSIGLGLDESRQLLVTFEERVPFALYCNSSYSSIELSLPTPPDNCFFLDEDSLIFALAPSFSGGAVYFIYANQEPIEKPLGKMLMVTEEFKLLSKFFEALAPLNVHPLALDIGESDYNLVLANGGRIIWRKSSNLTLIRSNLETFLSDDSIRAQGNFLDRILKLDLRTENKVFYKFRD